MNKNLTLSVGIPAYNEEMNIGKLVKSILDQDYGKIKLGKIIIYSDGSTDGTNAIVRGINSNKIKLIASGKRRGQAHAQNIIFKNSASDILVLLNADILIKDNNFIRNLAGPITAKKGVGLTSPMVVPLSPDNFFEYIIAKGHLEKNKLFATIGKNNIYLCHGRARALSKKLYKSFKFPNVIAEDAYSYLINKELGLEFYYVRNSKIYFRSPQSLHDHLKQSIRFVQGIKQLENFFDVNAVRKQFYIPKTKYMQYMFNYFKNSPLEAIIYVLVQITSITFSLFGRKYNHIWNVSVSSKKV